MPGNRVRRVFFFQYSTKRVKLLRCCLVCLYIVSIVSSVPCTRAVEKSVTCPPLPLYFRALGSTERHEARDGVSRLEHAVAGGGNY